MRRLGFTILLLLLCCNFFQYRVNRRSEKETDFEGQSLNCAVALGKGLRSSLRFGLNYELLQEFGENHLCDVSIKAVHDSLSLCDSLLAGIYDIVVLKGDDTAAVAGVAKFPSPDGNYIWATKSSKRGYRELACRKWLCYAVYEDEDLKLMNKLFSEPYNPFKRAEAGIRSKYLSPYDALVKKYAKEIRWDWRMLTALIYAESKFTINNVSPRGAVGLMQVMPREIYGTAEELMDPETNIKAGTSHLATIQEKFLTDPAFTPLEREKFALACYNAGGGRIAECRRIAADLGQDNTVWDQVVETFEFNDNFKGGETTKYVEYVLSLYEAFCTVAQN